MNAENIVDINQKIFLEMNAENTHSRCFALQLGLCWPQNICIVWKSAIPLIIYWNSHGLHAKDTFWPPSVSSDRRNGQNLFPDWCMTQARLLSFCSRLVSWTQDALFLPLLPQLCGCRLRVAVFRWNKSPNFSDVFDPSENVRMRMNMNIIGEYFRHYLQASPPFRFRKGYSKLSFLSPKS